MATRFENMLKPFVISLIKVYNTIQHSLIYEGKYILKGRPEGGDQIRNYNRERPFGPQKFFCFAPFKSLYFGADGKVLSCCYNREYVLGNYPASSIKEIWNGSKIMKLKAAMKNNDLTLGCIACKDQFDDKNYHAILSINYDKIPFNKDFPTLMEFELSNICNLGCIMCDERFSTYIAAQKNLPAMKMPYDEVFVNQLEEFIPYLKEAKFLGGEPFLIPLYTDIWEKIIDLNPECRIIVQTNATILPDKARHLMEKGNFHFNVSIDSFRKTTYESIRINADFEKTMENFRTIYQYCMKRDRYMGIAVCPVKQNWRELPEIIRYGNELNIAVYFNRVWNPDECSLWNWDPVNLLMIYESLGKEVFSCSNDIQHKNVQHYNEFIGQIYAWYLDSVKREEKNKISS